MKLFENLFSGSGSMEIAAPVAGKLVGISEVKDDVFSKELLGKGVAIIPSDSRFVSPVDGIVTMTFPTGHGVAVVSDEGAEILIHVGMDTVKLRGKHFTVHVEEGRKVKRGELLLEADIKQIEAEGYDIVTPIVVCNSDDFSEYKAAEPGEIRQGEIILKFQRREE